jgi:sulfur carrier protein
MSEGACVTITLNGSPYQAPEKATVLALLEMLGLARQRVAVEVNGRVVARDERCRTELRERDSVEVVRFVGGG